MGPILIIGHGLKTSSVLLVVSGIAVIVFGLLPSVDFFTDLPSLRGIIRKALPAWFGRTWFVAVGALLIYWGLTHGRP